MNAGYSGTPLIDKLGIKPGYRLALVQAPDGYEDLLGPLPAGVAHGEAQGSLDFIQVFVSSRAELESQFPRLKAALAANGLLWVSWPKRAARMKTDLDENIVREIGLAHGLVDVKVIAVDATWSGLKFVYRLSDRW